MYPWSGCEFVFKPACFPRMCVYIVFMIIFSTMFFFICLFCFFGNRPQCYLNSFLFSVVMWQSCVSSKQFAFISHELRLEKFWLSTVRVQWHPGSHPCFWGSHRWWEPSPVWSPASTAASLDRPCSGLLGYHPCWSSAGRARWLCGGTMLVLHWGVTEGMERGWAELNEKANGQSSFSLSIEIQA